MTIEELYELLAASLPCDEIRRQIKRENHISLSGLHGSAQAIVLKCIAQQASDRPILVVRETADDAQYLYSDLQTLGANAMYFPAAQRRRQGIDEAMQILRTEVLSSLITNPSSLIVISYPAALDEPVPDKDNLTATTVNVSVGQHIDQSGLTDTLFELGFERVDFVYTPGQFAVRGGIVDVYSFAHDDPYRIDFFGNEIDSIRTFDIENQLSKERVQQAALTISGDNIASTASASFYDYLPADTLHVEFQISNHQSPITNHKFNTLPQPVFRKNFDILADDLRAHIADGYRIFILADQKKQTDRLAAIFEDTDIVFTPVDKTLHAGFIDKDAKVCCYTDHEIFERFHRVTLRSENARRGKAIITLKEINQLRLGDYVVHSDHGIGQFGGLVTTSVNGKPQEMIKLTYRDGDTIFVSIHNLHRISKYKGREGSAPTISRIGSGAWERLKERTKDKVKDIARDLIRLYATRKQQHGFAYAPDGYLQHELEASFIYEDTPDQAKATLDVKHDLESPMPMDRLICGDVGFGKTEIAMRAAFKVATDGKQVAVLVPTTVLALQHYNTFCERFKDFPVRVEYLSRGKNAQQTADILNRLKKGEIDILIGTHKIVGKAVQWHDLGLLIIDEEQKFGVAVKEKLKSLRTNVDVLTLTATPIPRTLQFSLLGARDLSIMTTPPQNRYPVQTEVITPDDEDIIQDAIESEMERNGQVFIVCNRIEMLDRLEHRIHRLCPEARIVTAHGQMPTEEMEQRLEDFIGYRIRCRYTERQHDDHLFRTIIRSRGLTPAARTCRTKQPQSLLLSRSA